MTFPPCCNNSSHITWKLKIGLKVGGKRASLCKGHVRLLDSRKQEFCCQLWQCFLSKTWRPAEIFTQQTLGKCEACLYSTEAHRAALKQTSCMLISPHFTHSHNTASPHQKQNSKWHNYSQSEHIQCLYKYIWNDFTVGEATSAMRQHSNVASENLQKSHIDYFCETFLSMLELDNTLTTFFIGKRSAQIFSLMVYAHQKKKWIFALRY